MYKRERGKRGQQLRSDFYLFKITPIMIAICQVMFSAFTNIKSLNSHNSRGGY